MNDDREWKLIGELMGHVRDLTNEVIESTLNHADIYDPTIREHIKLAVQREMGALDPATFEG